jgi:8-oxo-dGTP diphosphatase
MPHIHIAPGQHDHTASAFILRIEQNVPKILLHKHKKRGVLTQVGGHIELNETPWQAVLHEIEEESGYIPEQLRVLQPSKRIRQLSGVDLHHAPLVTLTHEFSDGHFHSDTAWAFVTSEPPRQTVGKSESADLRFLTRQELAAVPSGNIPEDVREIGLFVFDICLPEWEEVSIS